MKITYIRLENVAGIKVGMNRETLEIDLSNSNNRLVAIQAVNGSGKTVLLSSLTPFSYVTSLDDRSSLPYIIPHKDGYKEIRYEVDGDQYVIKHYYKATKDTHSVKSYFMKNGEELNENGNVSSFNSLVEIHFGLTQEMMRLIRIGSNVSSFITLSPARRKEYIGKLISEIDVYLQVFKKVSDDLRVVRELTKMNLNALKKSPITDLKKEKKSLKELESDLSRLETQRSQIEARIFELEAMMKSNDIQSLRQRINEGQNSISSFQKLESRVIDSGLSERSLTDIMKEKTLAGDRVSKLQARVVELRLSIDNASRNISRIESQIARLTSNGSMDSLAVTASKIRSQIESTPDSVKRFRSYGSDSATVAILISKLSAFNQMANNLRQMGTTAIEIYCKITEDGTGIDRWLAERAQEENSGFDIDTLKLMIRKLFGDNIAIEPNCDENYLSCPYFRLSQMVNELKDTLDYKLVSPETVRSVQIISNTMESIMSELDRLKYIKVPPHIEDELNDVSIVKRLSAGNPLFTIAAVEEYYEHLRASELLQSQLERLSSIESQIAAFQASGIDEQIAEMKTLKQSIDSLNSELSTVRSDLEIALSEQRREESNYTLLYQYEEAKKYQSAIRSNLETAEKLLIPLEGASHEKSQLEFQLLGINTSISKVKSEIKEKEHQISEYKRLTSEAEKLKKVSEELSAIQEAASTKRGIPLIYERRYLSKISAFSNELLGMIYNGELVLDKFRITTDAFEIPYVKNNRRIPDIKFASQSEIALVTMALSFALADSTGGRYNIPLLDEVDAGLDDNNRSAMLAMLECWIDRLNCEQVFFISHNLSQMVNVPMDCIRLSDMESVSPLQNVIYEN